ncbi:hypothetical protein [Streptomyces sp. NPDC002550]
MSASCGTRLTDEWWTSPHLCNDCKQRAITAERQAEQATLVR